MLFRSFTTATNVKLSMGVVFWNRYVSKVCDGSEFEKKIAFAFNESKEIVREDRSILLEMRKDDGQNILQVKGAVLACR